MPSSDTDALLLLYVSVFAQVTWTTRVASLWKHVDTCMAVMTCRRESPVYHGALMAVNTESASCPELLFCSLFIGESLIFSLAHS